MKLRSVRVATTLPLFLAAALAWRFDYDVLAFLCVIAGVLLSLLQWMTVRALQHNAPTEPPSSGGSLADRNGGPI